jgi:hypothetical protein
MLGSGSRPRGRYALVCALFVTFAGAAPALASPPSASLRTADYWSLADRIAAAFGPTWDAQDEDYRWQGVADIRTNANMLTAHSIAALMRHTGAARQDARARAIVRHLTTAPVWRGVKRAQATTNGVSHPSTCWATDFAGTWPGHMSLESKVASALAWAYRARAALGLSPSATNAIRREVAACANSRAWRYPSLMANQINWPAEMYMSAATVTGSGALLRGDYRRQIVRFADGITHPMRGKRSANLSPSYAFHYRPDMPATAAINLDAPEYADIVMDSISYYQRALAVGMRPLPRRSVALMRAWVTRVLAGNWTHAGYLNWDTGHGFGRWHSAQYWAFAQQGLLAIATSPAFSAGNTQRRWAKALFDRSLTLYRAITARSSALLDVDEMFGVKPHFQDANAFHSRILANVTRAIASGLGRIPAIDPPPLYAYDYDTGRLAISTPSYSTAIVPRNRGAFPYGGIEMARLFADGQRVAANVGGLPPAAFGIVVDDLHGQPAGASQQSYPKARARLAVTQSPRGAITRPRPYPARPYAGAFGRITAVGSAALGSVRVRSTHSFGARSIDEQWHVADRARNHLAEAHFPTWGGDDAYIDVVLDDGTTVRLAGPHADSARPELAHVVRIVLGTSTGAGYSLTHIKAPANARLALVAAARQTSDPNPGPTLAIRLGSTTRPRDLSLTLAPFAN